MADLALSDSETDSPVKKPPPLKASLIQPPPPQFLSGQCDLLRPRGLTTPGKNLFGSSGGGGKTPISAGGGKVRISRVTPKTPQTITPGQVRTPPGVTDVSSTESISSILRSSLTPASSNKPATEALRTPEAEDSGKYQRKDVGSSPLRAESGVPRSSPLRNTRKSFWTERSQSSEVRNKDENKVETVPDNNQSKQREGREDKQSKNTSSTQAAPSTGETRREPNKRLKRKRISLSKGPASPVKVVSSNTPEPGDVNARTSPATAPWPHQTVVGSPKGVPIHLIDPPSEVSVEGPVVAAISPLKIDFEDRRFTLSSFLEQLEADSSNLETSTQNAASGAPDQCVGDNGVVGDVKQTAAETSSTNVTSCDKSKELAKPATNQQKEERVDKETMDSKTQPDESGEPKRKKKKRNKLSLSAGGPDPIILVHSDK